jgi:heptosyltransferase I
MPFVNEVIVYDRTEARLPSPRSLMQLHRMLAPHGFDVAIDFQGLARSARIAIVSGARTRVAFLDGREGAPVAANQPWLNRTSTQWVVDRYIELLETLGIQFRATPCYVPVSEESEALAAEFRRAEGIEGAPLLALALRGSWPSKFWPGDRFAEVARQAHERWGLVPVLLGGPGDRAAAEEVLAHARCPMIDNVGRLPLGASMAIVRGSAAVVGPDTGMVHAAMAFGVPLVCLFGPTDPERVAPRGENVRTVYHRMPCGPCNRKPTCVNYDCVLAISTEEVLADLEHVLERGPLPTR